MNIKKPTWCLDIPADEYHAATKANKYLSSHRLNTFRKCPLEYHKRITGEIIEGDTSTFMLGRATHTFILEGREKFAADFVVSDGPINPKTGKAFGKLTEKYREWAEAQTTPAIGTDDMTLIEKMDAAVRGHEKAAELLSSGFAEATIRTDFCGLPVQARLDWYDPARDIIVDLKTTNDVDRFTYDVRDFGYIHQLAFYAAAVRNARMDADDADNTLPSCWLVAVEKREPFRVAVYQLSDFTIGDALLGNGGKLGLGIMPAIEELADCQSRNVWPTRYEGCGVL